MYECIDKSKILNEKSYNRFDYHNAGYMHHYVLGKIQKGREILAWKLEIMIYGGIFFFQRNKKNSLREILKLFSLCR